MIKRFTLKKFTLAEIFDLFINQFDQYLITQCQHFKDQQFMNAMSEIQNYSAMFFFIMIHIPLSKISSLFCLVTALIPLILDKKNKEDIYLTLHQLVNNGLITTRILRKNQETQYNLKTKKYQEFRENQKGAINFTVFYFGVFFALLFNYLFTLYFGSFLVSQWSFNRYRLLRVNS